MCSDSGAAAGEEEVPRRQLLRWSKAETLRLLHAKRKREDSLSIPATTAHNSSNINGGGGGDERFGDANKWRCVSDSLRSDGFDRDHVACKKRWFHLVADYRKIHDWQRSNAAGGGSSGQSFWDLQPQERREKRLPSGFDRDVYRELDVWIGAGMASAATSSLNPAPALDDPGIGPNAELDLVDRVSSAVPVSESQLASRKRRKQGKEADASKVPTTHGDFRDNLIQVLEKNGTSIEITLRDICQAQIDAQKQISQNQLEAQKQIMELQMQQGREFLGAMYSMVGVLGELAKSLRSSVSQ